MSDERNAWRCTLACAVCLAGCIDVGQERVQFDVHVAGRALDEIEARHGWTVELSRADLAFGPLFLCASTTAGDLCEPARAEWLDSVVVDTLDPASKTAGMGVGLEGEVRSFMYELGATWPLAQPQPQPTTAGEALDEHALKLAGVARREGREVHFEAEVAVAANTAGRTVASGQLDAQRLGADVTTLRARFDPERFVAQIDFDELAGTQEAEAADQDGPIRIRPDSQAHRAVVSGLVSNGRPDIAWDGSAQKE
ncbi:MAG: hypothetical protein OXU20_14590 [Myxococcales bacterium]|nr:hypothetical protein [Myxococcales bacterium]